ncbi:MAG TPA: hypothetical protein VLX32_14445 [Candidatus Acidoferrum sp.]|nr:hypothetical protein [Candidatus Acidoferrum sp.]
MTRSIFRFLPLALGAALLIPAARAQSRDNEGCSNSTLKGDYAFRVSGEIFVPNTTTTPPTPTTSIMAYRDGVAITHFDGRGTLSQTDFIMGNGLAPADPRQPTYTDSSDIDSATGFSINETGSYHVNSDCTGWAEIDFPPADKLVNGAPVTVSPGTVIKLVLVVANNGRTIHTVVSSLWPAGAPGPVFANIHSDAERIEPLIDHR